MTSARIQTTLRPTQLDRPPLAAPSGLTLATGASMCALCPLFTASTALRNPPVSSGFLARCALSPYLLALLSLTL